MAGLSSGLWSRREAVRASTLDRLFWIESKSLTSAASNAACCAVLITTSNCTDAGASHGSGSSSVCPTALTHSPSDFKSVPSVCRVTYKATQKKVSSSHSPCCSRKWLSTSKTVSNGVSRSHAVKGTPGRSPCASRVMKYSLTKLLSPTFSGKMGLPVCQSIEILPLTCSTASLGSFDSSSRMPGSVTPSCRCSGSAASLSSCAARLATCSSVWSMTGAGESDLGSSCSDSGSSSGSC
eukprot:scaffold87170_cov69-Phaeocystis_antarctica.AAC.1